MKNIIPQSFLSLSTPILLQALFFLSSCDAQDMAGDMKENNAGESGKAVALVDGTPEPGRRYQVAGLPTDGTLPLYQQSDRDSEVLAQWPSGLRDIVVTGIWESGRDGEPWWQVTSTDTETGTAWINPRFLTPMAPNSATPGVLPGSTESDYPLGCRGTEPFWLLELDTNDGQAVLSTPGGSADGPTIERQEWQTGRLQGGYGFSFVVQLGSEGLSFSGWAVIRRHSQHACSDGMSENFYPFTVTLIAPSGDAVHGCCWRAR